VGSPGRQHARNDVQHVDTAVALAPPLLQIVWFNGGGCPRMRPQCRNNHAFLP